MVHSHNYLVVLGILASWFPEVCGLFEWLRQSELPPTAELPPPPGDLSPAILVKDVQFEISTADEKFLAEAKRMELSLLDRCHHRVVAQLKASCERLSEEELAKLGVALFNCQAQIEGRKTYQCTEQMSIKECTANMDSDTWNAYHIVSNRARAVCYATRQQLFRRRAEDTVNTLISATSSQLSAMEDLKDGQLELREMTAASLEKLMKGYSALHSQQVKLFEGQGQIESSLLDNLEHLYQEKALIASGQELVAQLIQGITDKMAIVSESVQNQGSEVQDSHRTILQDLANVRHEANSIHQKIDDGMTEFLQYQDQTLKYYSDLMSKLERMNSSLGFMLHSLDEMQGQIQEKLDLIEGYLGLSVPTMWTFIAHTSYFVLLAVLQSFLRCAVFSRVVLLFTVPLNALAEVNQQPALDLSSLSLLIVMLSLGHWFVSQMGVKFPSRRRQFAALPFVPYELVEQQKSSNSYPQFSTPRKEEPSCYEPIMVNEDTLSGHLGMSSVSDGKPASGGGTHHSALSQPVLSQAMRGMIPQNTRGVFDALNDSSDGIVSRSARTPQSSTNSSLSGRQLCNAITKTGKSCKKSVRLGQEYCRFHESSPIPYLQSL
ncbi:protein brambleberry isoform X2 [Corythoichthys intestinalis]|uniref:protein brambleberry isoform X2 n=1 Tax=Corythoichthys intestinalis TaxID=161448 RepID=UPI0025A63D8D|nr:protein brambleberry isoform X2 [Corythoichthys intestinalis]